MSTTSVGDSAQQRRSPATTRVGELLEQSASGDQAAFATLYAETASRVFGLALRVVRDRSHAEDVTQEAYLRIWRTAALFDAQRGDGVGWIFMIVHRVAIDHVRSAQSRTVRDDRHHRETSTSDPADRDPTHDLAQARGEATRAREALTHLSAPQREALELAYFDGHTYAEVATLLGVAPGTIKSRIRDGLIRLRGSTTPPDGPLATA